MVPVYSLHEILNSQYFCCCSFLDFKKNMLLSLREDPCDLLADSSLTSGGTRKAHSVHSEPVTPPWLVLMNIKQRPETNLVNVRAPSALSVDALGEP